MIRPLVVCVSGKDDSCEPQIPMTVHDLKDTSLTSNHIVEAKQVHIQSLSGWVIAWEPLSEN